MAKPPPESCEQRLGRAAGQHHRGRGVGRRAARGQDVATGLCGGRMAGGHTRGDRHEEQPSERHGDDTCHGQVVTLGPGVVPVNGPDSTHAPPRR